MWFDTHAHLDDAQFADRLEILVDRALAAGVEGMVAIGTSAASSEACRNLAGRFAQVWAAVGIQPNHVAEAADDDWPQIERLASSDRVVAVGETGLDRYWDDTPFPLQQDYFDRHLQLAQRHDLPVVIHMRECGADVVDMLRAATRRAPLRGIMHSFTGDLPLAEECLGLGLHISFAGMVTYKKSDALRQVAAGIPAERLLLETDAPYLSPHPHRGHRPNEPALLVHTGQCLAEVRGVPPAELASQTTANARTLFRIR